MNQMERPSGPTSLPLVIGVTGHRDLRPEDVPQLEHALRDIIQKLRSDNPHTPFTLLSSLAEGADRLVARVALELGLNLIVPLPLKRDSYETDFTSEASRAEFRNLLDKSAHWFALPLLNGVPESEIKDRGPARDRQYELAGAYIVRHSHLLVALWNGKNLESVGGTSKIISFQLRGVPEPYAPASSVIDTPESGPVYQIVTPRKSDPGTEGTPFQLRKLFPKGYLDESERFSRIRTRIDEFNRDLIKEAVILKRSVSVSSNQLLPDTEAEVLRPADRVRREQFAVADVLALHFSDLTRRTLNRLFLLVLLAAIAFDLYAHLFPDVHWIAAAYLLLVAAAYLWVNRRAVQRDYQNKYQDYRALAEGTRVQFFWGLADLDSSVDDRYLRRQRSELDWICSAIRVWTIPSKTTAAGEHERAPHAQQKTIELVNKHWVADQAAWFQRAAKREHSHLEMFEPYIPLLLRVGVGVAVITAGALLIPHPWQQQLEELMHEHHSIHGVMLALISLPPIFAALLHSYLEKRALSEHAKRYSRMSVMFANAEQRLTEMIGNRQFDRARDLIEELGREALSENGDWVILHRERPLEVPHAG